MLGFRKSKCFHQGLLASWEFWGVCFTSCGAIVASSHGGRTGPWYQALVLVTLNFGQVAKCHSFSSSIDQGGIWTVLPFTDNLSVQVANRFSGINLCGFPRQPESATIRWQTRRWRREVPGADGAPHLLMGDVAKLLNICFCVFISITEVGRQKVFVELWGVNEELQGWVNNNY